MTLTFLTPAVLVGAALIAVPIIIHLILKKKPKHLLFPAFRFLQQKHRTNLQKLRLRHLLLLAMRILMILLICAALARPQLTGGPSELAGNAKIGAILAFDTSASMGYEHNGKSLLDAAKEEALTFIRQLPPGSRVAVLDTAESGGQPVDVGQAESLIVSRQIQATSRPVTDVIKEAFRLLEAEKAKSSTEGTLADLPLILCVFSDRTTASWNADTVSAALRPGKQRLEERLGRELPCVYLDFGPPEAHNVAITGLNLKRSGTGEVQALERLTYGVAPRGEVQIQASVQVTGANVDSEVLLSMDGETKDTKRLKAAAQPGQAIAETISFQPIKLTANVHQGEVRLKNHDALKEDDVRYWTLAVVQRKVLIVADQPADAESWKAALEAASYLLPMSGEIVTPSNIPANLHPDQYQAVCLMNVAKPTPDLWERLYRYVAAGGGLVVLPGEDCEPEFYNTDVALKVLPASLTKIIRVPLPGAILTPLNYDHPIMSQFKAWEKRLPPGRVYKFWDLALEKDVSRIIVPYDFENKPALVERAFDPRKIQGRVLLLTTAMYRRVRDNTWKDWNDYQSESWMAIAWPYLTVRYVLGARETRNNFGLDEEVRFWLPRGPGFASYDVSGPQNGSGDVAAGQAQLSVTQARRPGNYKVAAPSGSWGTFFSVNLPPAETQFVPRLNPADIDGLFGEKSVQPAGQAGSLPDLVRSKLGQSPKSELLPYLMISLLLFLAAENLLANRFYRRDPDLPN